MQISPVNISRPIAEDATPEEVRSVDAQGRSLAVREEKPSPRPASALRRGLAQWNPKFNEQLSAAQQALAYLSRLESRLQELKTRLSSQLAAGQGSVRADPQIDSELREVADLWQQRQSLGGGLDGQLGYSTESAARQRFTIKGLDRQALTSGAKENLVFTAAGHGQSPITVTVDPALSEKEMVGRFQQAFASAGIDVNLDGRGNLSFSIAESGWPGLRDSLSARGNGIRFPVGQFARIKAEAVPDAIRPEAWGSSDAAAVRRTLQEVVDALARVRQVEEKLSRALAEARLQIQSLAVSVDAESVGSFAADFEALAEQPAYEVYAAVAPALASLSRERVVSLLVLD